MRKSLTYKILAAVMALSAANWAVPADVLAGVDTDGNYIVTDDGEIVIGDSTNPYNNVYGNGHSFTITSGKITGDVYGVGNGDNNYREDASGGNVSIIDSNLLNYEGARVLVCGGRSGIGSAHHNTVNISGDNSRVTIVNGGESTSGKVYNNTVNISGGSVGYAYGGNSYYAEAYNNTVSISGGSVDAVFGGYSGSGEVHHNTVKISGGSVGAVFGGYSGSGEVHHNTVNISGDTVTGNVHGGWSDNGEAYGNTVNISNGTVTGYVCGGYIYESGSAYDNEVVISGSADITNARLFGCNDMATDNTGNTLTIDGWSGSTQSVKNFNDIAFKNINWNNGGKILIIINTLSPYLANTKIETINIAGGSNINVGESMTLIESKNSNDIGLTEGNVKDTFTAGVAREGLGSTRIDGNVVTFNVNSIKLSSQAESAAQTRAASAAFVNQGTDLISDSLDTISRDDNYGVKTFAAVHGNRSKYDVADDIKINGWSTIVGVGNADKFDNGSELSWGVFYENGSGNYRTYNTFNNEFFRGDGSMVYNGGGIAARYENKNGVYTEGSLRAGMLKNELDNAMRNVNGSYGYETESAYYGAHIGVGKIISLSDSSDLDIYGKFFHTYTEGDSVNIAGDKFDFDSITSDRLRVGARITSNKENKFSTYYGLAYEYEFNGDADMTAQGLRADTQSIQGSSVMAEVGFNYQPTPDSPWSFDLNMRGYAGERQGGSFNVQATYTF